MVHCRSCGKQMEGVTNFCPHCGAAARPLPPPYPYEPRPRGRNPLLIAFAIIAAFFLIQVLLAAGLYIMVMGTGSPATPMATLSWDMTSSEAIDFTILAVSRGDTLLTDVWMSLTNNQGDTILVNIGDGFIGSSNVSQASNAHFEITYLDADENRRLSSGDTVTVSSTSGPLAEGDYTLVLRDAHSWFVIASLTASIP